MKVVTPDVTIARAMSKALRINKPKVQDRVTGMPGSTKHPGSKGPIEVGRNRLANKTARASRRKNRSRH